MVIFGGLELVAAGYILHKHNKNKRERRRLEEEAEELDPPEQRSDADHLAAQEQGELLLDGLLLES